MRAYTNFVVCTEIDLLALLGGPTFLSVFIWKISNPPSPGNSAISAPARVGAPRHCMMSRGLKLELLC